MRKLFGAHGRHRLAGLQIADHDLAVRVPGLKDIGCLGRDIPRIPFQLKLEGYSAAYITGKGLTTQLKALINSAKKRRNDTIH